MVPMIIGPVGFIWSIIYYILGHNVSASIPMFYTFASILTLIHFHKTKNITFILEAQTTLILLLPFILMWSLGGFAQSSYIFIWAFFAPIIAIIHDKSKKSLSWLYSFIALVVFSALIDQKLEAVIDLKMSPDATELFYILNISVALSGIYLLIHYFLDEKDKNTNQQLRQKHDALLEKTKELYDNISYLESYKNNIDNNLIVTRTDIHGNITFANKNFYTITGYTEAEVIGKSHNIIRHPDNPKEMFAQLWKTLLSKKVWHGTIKNRKKDGTTYWVDATISPILNKDKEIVEFIAIRHNITKLMQHQDELTRLLYIDTLTDLPNRNALQRDIKRMENLSCILINIDNFSHINNLYGETFGDRVLIEFSNLLVEILHDNPNINLYRLGGDEFIFTLHNQSETETLSSAQELLKLSDNTSFIVDDQDIILNVTLGISFEEGLELLRTAEMAVTAARKESKDVKVYSDALSLYSEYENNIKWIREIKEAIAEDRIQMFYQPIIDNHDSSHKKYETLIRLIDKYDNIITPYYFLEIAKKAKLYKQLTKIVLHKSFEAFKDNDYDFSINLTVDDILDGDIRGYIIETLEKYSISNRVIFEIVESESIENFDAIEEFIIKVKSYGCRISIDDFGTGYSNFEHLMRLQADFIKIDGSIIKEITHDKRSALITSVIVAFAKEMGIETIGEFVETKEIHEKLISLGVNKSQGYYFNKPLKSLD